MFSDALSPFGFLIVPVGLAWTIAAGLVLLRRRGATRQREPVVDVSHASEKAI
jgi:hypothetical protein